MTVAGLHPRVVARPFPRRSQRGVATLLILLMVGLAMSIGVVATIYSLRGAQSRQLTVRASTNAQAIAWRGVEALRRALEAMSADDMSALADEGAWPKDVTGMEAMGIRSAKITSIVPEGSGSYQVEATVTGEAGSGNIATTATVEVVYGVAPDASGSPVPAAPAMCQSLPRAPLVFNGNLSYSGGKLEIVNAIDYENVVVAGDLTISNGSAAKVSGCVKGNISLSGGGLSANGHLYSEGTITVASMSPPSGTTLWGRQITLDGSSSSAKFAALKAGAYAVSLVSDGSVVGTATIGGRLIPSTVGGGIPWVQGTVLPLAGAGDVLVRMVDGSEFLLDLDALAVDPATGTVTGATAAAEWLHGSATMPDSFVFRSDSIYGGGILTQGIGRTELVWGHAVSVGLNNGSLTGSVNIGQLLANGDLEIGSGSVDSLVGGGYAWARGASLNGHNYRNFPTIGSGVIAGKTYYSGSKTVVPVGDDVALLGIASGRVNTSPGLPGVPYCDARVHLLDADDYRDSANYIFESVAGKPKLTIQNVKRADGTSIDGVYMLKSLTGAQATLLQGLMSCEYGNDKGCTNMLQSNGSWKLGGVQKMPPGVLWFDGGVTVAGTNVDLLNTIVNKGGDVYLNSSGHGDLIAPNSAGVSAVCGAAYYPSNLCDGTSSFAAWEDADGDSHTGLPIGNTAVISEEGATVEGWTISGNMLLGKQIATGGALVTVRGSITAGSNTRSNSGVTAGGLLVQVPPLNSSDLKFLPVCSVPTPATPPPAGGNPVAKVRWSRYL